MGWSRTFFLGDNENRLDIVDIKESLSTLKSTVGKSVRHDMTQDEKLAVLTTENTDLLLHIAALYRILLAKGIITHQELDTILAALDTGNGPADGKGKL